MVCNDSGSWCFHRSALVVVCNDCDLHRQNSCRNRHLANGMRLVCSDCIWCALVRFHRHLLLANYDLRSEHLHRQNSWSHPMVEVPQFHRTGDLMTTTPTHPKNPARPQWRQQLPCTSLRAALELLFWSLWAQEPRFKPPSPSHCLVQRRKFQHQCHLDFQRRRLRLNASASFCAR